MIRPEVRDALWPWREVLAGAALAVVGAWLWLAQYGLPALFGAAMVLGGAFLALTGWRRMALRGAAPGPGVVEVVEGRIGYLGPGGGGWAALDLLDAVEKSGAAWRLVTAEDVLEIPVGARGADGLPDALGPLPGFDAGRMARAARMRGDVTVWRRRGGPAALPRA